MNHILRIPSSHGMNVELGEAPMEKNPAASDGFSTASNVTGLSGSHNTGP